MKKYKYFHASNLDKETIGIVKARDLHEAYIKASYKKKLAPMHFRELFNVEEIQMGSKKVFIAGMGWCYEVTAELKDKLIKKSTKQSKNNVTGNKKVRIFNQIKK